MLTALVILCIVSLLFLVAAMLILMGKGDAMIVGYHAASAVARDKDNLGRKRVIYGILLILVAAILVTVGLMLYMGYGIWVVLLLPPVIFMIVVVAFTTIHFWAKRK